MKNCKPATIFRCSCITSLLILLCSCGQKQDKPAPPTAIEFNYAENYPKSDLRLSDLADIEYVALSDDNDCLASGKADNSGHNFCITPEEIYYNDAKTILVFDRQGKGLRKIDRTGNGPEEYIFIADFFIDSKSSELFVLDPHGKKIIIYDTKGNFKRNFRYGDIPAWQMVSLNDSVLITGSFPFMPTKYYALSKTDGRILKEFQIPNDKNMEYDPEGMLAYATVFPVSGGCILADQNIRTKYLVDQDLNLTPLITDNYIYEKNEVSLHPSIETDQYYLFYLLYSPFATPNLKPTGYIYDKQKKQFSQLQMKKPGVSSVLNGDCLIFNRFATQDRDIAVRPCSAASLISMNEKGELDGKLKEIASNLKEDDNPVLMIMKFR